MTAYPEGYSAKFVIFHDANEWILDKMIRHACELKSMGHAGVGVRYLYEDLRYNCHPIIETDIWDKPIGTDFGLDNNFCPEYGRLIAERVPELASFIRTRLTDEERAAQEEADRQAAAALQPALEFEID